jgi:hypothetical protein
VYVTNPNHLMPAGPGAQTNDLGEFRLHSLLAGEYYIGVTPRGDFGGAGPFAASTSSTGKTMVPTYFPGTADSAAAQPIIVAAGQTSGDVVVRMIVATASEVSGVVVDEAGQPLADALVRLTPRDLSGPGMIMMMRRPNQTRTDGSGAFRIGQVTNGAYTLIAIPRVVTSSRPERGGGGGGVRGTIWSSAGSSGGVGPAGGAVMTEAINGVTAEFRDDTGTQIPVDVNDGNVANLRIVVPRPAR